MGDKVFSIIKWVIIGVLCISLVVLLKGNHDLKTSYEAYKKDGTYVNMYQSKTIKDLKKENTELYNSIKNKQDVNYAAVIKYKYIYNGDTVYISRKLPQIRDSLYTFSKKTDSISYDLKVMASNVEWYR